MNLFSLLLNARAVAGIFVFVTLLANPLTADVGCKNCASISKRNWYNSMGCDQSDQRCVALFSDNIMMFTLRVRVMDPDVLSYPLMRFSYNFPLVDESGFTDFVYPWMLTPVVMGNGVSAYEASFTFVFDLSDFCPSDESFEFPAEHQLVDASGQAYHVEAYPNFWPPGTFHIPPGGYAWPHSDVKNICCDGSATPCSNNSLVANPDTEIGTLNLSVEGMENKDFYQVNGVGGFLANRFIKEQKVESQSYFTVFPNPFYSNVSAQYELEEPGSVKILCLDAHGKTVREYYNYHDVRGIYEAELNTVDWSAGLYYIQILTHTRAHTIKLIKLDK